VKSREGEIRRKQKPKAELARQAMKGLVGCLEQLGLTPASAGRVRPLPLAKKLDPAGIESYFDNPPEPSA
jgi:hypothetical protein